VHGRDGPAVDLPARLLAAGHSFDRGRSPVKVWAITSEGRNTPRSAQNPRLHVPDPDSCGLARHRGAARSALSHSRARRRRTGAGRRAVSGVRPGSGQDGRVGRRPTGHLGGVLGARTPGAPGPAPAPDHTHAAYRPPACASASARQRPRRPSTWGTVRSRILMSFHSDQLAT
jgi:hypothetical protein